MTQQRVGEDVREVMSVVVSLILMVTGCWLLAAVAGAVAILAVIVTAAVYVPLRILHLEGRLRGASPPGAPTIPSPRRPVDDLPPGRAGRSRSGVVADADEGGRR